MEQLETGMDWAEDRGVEILGTEGGRNRPQPTPCR